MESVIGGNSQDEACPGRNCQMGVVWIGDVHCPARSCSGWNLSGVEDIRVVEVFRLLQIAYGRMSKKGKCAWVATVV